jgi:cytochrome P450
VASLSFFEWGKYMDDLFRIKKEEISKSKDSDRETMDLMGAMISGSGLIPGSANFGNSEAGLTKEEVIGNSFVIMVAGHETAANSVHFGLIELAMNIKAQRHLQGMC